MERPDPTVPVCAGRRAVAHDPVLMVVTWVCPTCGEQDWLTVDQRERADDLARYLAAYYPHMSLEEGAEALRRAAEV